MKDPYQVLGVPRDADDKRIKEEYRRLARKHHPDVNPGDKAAEERFKDIQAAYDLLSDAKKRQAFDQFGSAAFESGGGARGPSDAGGAGFGFPSFEDIFGAGSLNDILSGLFGGRGRGGPGPAPAPERGEDIQAVLEVAFEDAMRGTERELTLPGRIPCATCHGSGADPNAARGPCPECKGTGQKTLAKGSLRFGTTCSACGGTGQRRSPCPTCGGQGFRSEPRQVRVRIPAGVEDGALLRVPNQGLGASGGAGDLYLRVQVLPHPVFRREGADLHVELPVSLTEAALGAELEVPTLDGAVRIRVPEGTPSGRRIRLAGKGVAPARGGGGDLYVAIRIVPPPAPSGEERELLEKLARASTFNPRTA